MKNAWETRLFSEIGRVFNGNSINESEKKVHFEGLEEGVPYIGTKDVSFDHEIEYESGVKIPAEKQEGFKLAPANTVFVCAEGGSAGKKIALSDRAVYFGNKLFAISPTPSTDSRFVFYYCLGNAFSSQFKNAMSGLIGGVSINKFKGLSIILPPLPEQQRIVSILDEAFAGIATATANAEKNLANARELFESYLQLVFSNKGENWIESTVGETIRFIDYRGKTPQKTNHGLRLITAKNVKMGFLQHEPMEFVSPNTYESWMTRGIPQRGDILFTTEAPLANVAQLDTEDRVVFAQRIIIMQADKTKLDNTFLKYLLLSQPVQQRIHNKGTGATVKGIKASLLKTIEISYPKSIAEQLNIVAKLDELALETKRLEAIYQQKLNALEELKKSILNQAFSGQLQ